MSNEEYSGWDLASVVIWAFILGAVVMLLMQALIGLTNV